MSKNKNRFWLWFLVIITIVVLLAVILNRSGIEPRMISGIQIPEISDHNSVHFTEVSDRIGENLWVYGNLDHVFVSSNNNYFLNFCEDFRDCPFNSVIFSNHADQFNDIEGWVGEIYIYGNISYYQNRAQIVIEYSEQVRIEDIDNEQVENNSLLFEVMSVIDGDTIVVRVNGSSEFVRLIGIDTPEVSGPHTSQECFGEEASVRVMELLEGRRVVLLSDPQGDDYDKYGRLLRYVFTEDGQHVNAMLIEDGYAFYFPYKPFVFMDYFARLEKGARKDMLGLWGDVCDYR